ncbi:hypothetical protein [Nonomuraea sp. NPDC023979]|uniref:hypothetical protein n=1 Tax=Nonomuraea sp. NPDC023979 TaxID=3154796 RepID=UPI00340961DA
MEAAPAGMTRLTRPDSTGQALPVWPDGVTPSLLEEHQVPPMPVERSGETRRVLAAVLKCCWSDHTTDPWPGDPAPLERVLDTYRALIGRTDDLMRNWAIGALRRLHDSAWVSMSDGIVSLGPRCALWPVESHAVLQELVRRIPEPERRALTVVADADLVAAARPAPPSIAVPQSTAPPARTPSTPAPGHAAPETTEPHDPPPPGQPDAVQDGHPPQDHQPVRDTQPQDEHPVQADRDAQAPRAGQSPPVGRDAEPPQAGQPAQDPQPPQDEQPAQDAQPVPDAQPAQDVRLRAEGSLVEGVAGAGGRVEAGVAEFGDLLDAYDERRRAELVAAFMVVEHAAEPVQEARFAALRDPALRHTLAAMLARRGRVLVQHRERWISGYDDEIAALHRAPAAEQPADAEPSEPGVDGRRSDRPAHAGGGRSGAQGPGQGLGESERAVLTLVLVHSVAIPRAEGLLPEDSWLSPHPTPVDELRRHTQLPIGELESALRTLRHAGLLTQVKAGEEAGGYVPGPQFHRLTPAARRRLQEELILAAGPDTPLAAAVRARRTAR